MEEKKLRGKYTTEFKMEAVRQVKAGQAISVTARVLGIPKASVSNWVRESAKGTLGSVGNSASIVTPECPRRLKVDHLCRLKCDQGT
jgi:transposase